MRELWNKSESRSSCSPSSDILQNRCGNFIKLYSFVHHSPDGEPILLATSMEWMHILLLFMSPISRNRINEWLKIWLIRCKSPARPRRLKHPSCHNIATREGGLCILIDTYVAKCVSLVLILLSPGKYLWGATAPSWKGLQCPGPGARSEPTLTGTGRTEFGWNSKEWQGVIWRQCHCIKSDWTWFDYRVKSDK